MTRGVKQGDPISGLLFIAVLEERMRNLKKKWALTNKKRCGLQFGMPIYQCSENLTNLRFADDILLIATSRSDIAKMVSHLKDEASKYGLKMHTGKTKVLTNSRSRRSWRDIEL